MTNETTKPALHLVPQRARRERVLQVRLNDDEHALLLALGGGAWIRGRMKLAAAKHNSMIDSRPAKTIVLRGIEES